MLEKLAVKQEMDALDNMPAADFLQETAANQRPSFASTLFLFELLNRVQSGSIF